MIATTIKTQILNVGVYALFFAGFLLMGSNNYLNLYVLRRHFPNKPLSSALSRLRKIVFVLNVLFTLLLVLLMAFGASEEFSNQGAHEKDGKELLLLLLLVLSHWVYTLLMQVKMKAVMKREYHQLMNNIINSIGQQ